MMQITAQPGTVAWPVAVITGTNLAFGSEHLPSRKVIKDNMESSKIGVEIDINAFDARLKESELLI